MMNKLILAPLWLALAAGPALAAGTVRPSRAAASGRSTWPCQTCTP